MGTLTKLLCNHQIVYQWRYPAKLLVTKDHSTHMINSLEEGLKLAKQWELLPSSEENHRANSSKKHLSHEWEKAR